MQTSDTDLRTEAFTLFGRLFAQSDPTRLDDWVKVGLTLTQVRVLGLLEAEEGLRAGDLAAKLEVQPSTVTRIVDRLVQAKFVRRDADPEDRRMVRHYLTESGVAAITRLRRSGRARFQEVFGRLNEGQLAEVVSALRVLTNVFDLVKDEA